MNLLKLAFLFVLTISIQTSIDAQDWVSYQSQQQINDLVDTGGELLLATDEGLVVVNKTTLEKTIFNNANSNLSNNHIQTITEAPNGDFWIGTYDAILLRFDGEGFQDATILEGETYDQYTILYDFKIAPNGDIWVGTSDGLFHKQGQNWFHYDQTELGPVFFEAWAIEIDDAGAVFIGSHTIHKYTNGVWSNLTEDTELFSYLDANLFFSTTGDLYMSGGLGKMGRFDGEQWHIYEDFGVDLNAFEIIKFVEDTEGNVYFNTQKDGIFKLVNDAWVQQEDEQATAFNNKSSYFYIDEQNNRWLNNKIELSVNKNGTIQTTSIAPHTIESNNVYNIHKGNNGQMCFITISDEDNIAVVDEEGNWSMLPLPDSLLSFENFSDMLFLAENDIWLASNRGLHHYNGNEWTFNDLEPCRRLSIDSQAKIYAQASYQMYIINNGVITEYNTDNSPIIDTWISGHGIDADDNLWIAAGGENVIQKISTDGSWTSYTDTEFPAIDNPTGDFHFDINGNVWIPSQLVGAMKFDGETWTNPYAGNLDEIENYNAFSIESDATGKIYFSHQYGVTTLLDGEWEDLLIEDVPNTISSHNSTIQFDDNGTLWWASNRYGVFSYTPESTTSVESNFEITTTFSVYPNPAEEYSIFDFTTKKQADIQVFIYNQLGQLQANLDLGELPVGAFQHRINVADFPMGFYSIQLWVDDEFTTKTMIVH